MYTFDVLANTSVGDGKVSMPRSFTTLQVPPTPPVSPTFAFHSCSSLFISWNPPVCSYGEVLGYMVRKKYYPNDLDIAMSIIQQVEYSPPTGFPASPFNITANASTFHVLNNLLSNTSYTISVSALNAAGCSKKTFLTARIPKGNAFVDYGK